MNENERNVSVAMVAVGVQNPCGSKLKVLVNEIKYQNIFVFIKILYKSTYLKYI